MPADSAPPRGGSILPCHRWPAEVKLALTFAVVLAGVLTPPAHWPVHGFLGCVTFVGHTWAGVPMRLLIRRVAWFLPPILLVALWFPLWQGFQTGWSVSAAIVLRST